MNFSMLRHKPRAARCLLTAAAICAALAAYGWARGDLGALAAQTASCVAAPPGMAAWWPGDGNAQDIQGANHGTPENGAAFAPGMVGQAFSLDGVDDGVSLGDVRAFDFDQSSSFTVGAWVKTAGPNGQSAQTIVSLNYDCTPTRQMLYIIGTGPDAGKVAFSVRDADDVDSMVVAPSVLPAGEFHHVAATREVTSGGKTLNLYVDGTLVASVPDVTTGSLSSNAADWIGRKNFCHDVSAFNGVIDEVEVFGRALTAAEVKSVFDSGGAGKCRPSCAEPPAGMRQWYTGDGHARDIQGPTFEDGSLLNGATYAAGKVAQAFSFGDSDGDAVVVPASAFNDAFAELTLDAWVFPVSHGGTGDGEFGRVVISNTETDGFALRVRDGFLQADLRLSGGDLIQTFSGQTDPLPLHQWSHVAISYDGAAVRGYVNGAPVGSIAASGTVRNIVNSGTCLMIGNEPSACTVQSGGFVWGGRIDEVQVFDRALSAAEVQRIYAAGPEGTCRVGSIQFDAHDYVVGEGGGAAVITVTRTGWSGGAASVNFSTADGTAAAGADYTATSVTVNFAAGETGKTVAVPIAGDAAFEADETVNLSLSGVTAAALGAPSTATLTITNDDAAPSLSIGDVTAAEGDAGTPAFTFTVTKAGATALPASVSYATANGTAAAGSDYAAASGTLTFAPGDTLKTVTVSVNGDTTFEPDETFFVNLSGASGAVVGDAQGLGTITNDEAPSTFQFSSAAYSAAEGGGAATVTVSRAGSAAGGVSVNYATAAGGTAAAGSDYTAASGTLSFAAGETSKTFSVPVADDTLDEPDETVSLALSSPVGGTLGPRSTAVLTITDNDAAPSVGVADTSATEGQGLANFNVTLSAASGLVVTVNYVTADGTAVAPGDYTAVTSGTLTFNPGETSKQLSVAVADDALDEADETFFVNLSSPANATVSAAQGVGTISDDDPAPSLSVDDVTATEGGGGATAQAIFTVSLSAASGRSVSVGYTTADGTARAGEDYTAATGTLVFAPGETSKHVQVAVAGDTSREVDETFFLDLAGATGAAVGDGRGVGTIRDDDTPTVQFSRPSFTGAEAAHLVTLAVRRTGDPSIPFEVDYATQDGTADERNDYTTALGTLRFAAGETEKSLEVLLTDDGFAEGEESFAVTLANPTGGAAPGEFSTASVRIEDDEPGTPAPSNPIDADLHFVRQHYHDFLNREPDAEGFRFWADQLAECEPRPEAERERCREVKRVNVSAAFFLSIEFQETGYLIYRLYAATFGRQPRYLEFVRDTQEIGRGVIVGQGDWRAQLEANRRQFLDRWVGRAAFRAEFDRLSDEQYVDKLFAGAGVVPSAGERDALVAGLGNGTETRAGVLRRVAENEELRRAEFNRAFVLMQYFGYLRRDPDAAPDGNLDGYHFWLAKLNDHRGNYISAEMVRAFTSSAEFRRRFGL